MSRIWSLWARRGRRPLRALAIAAALLGAVTLSLGPAQGPATAHAATCSNSSGQVVDCATGHPLGQDVAPHDYGPPSLLNFVQPLYAATAAQIQSLRALEGQAVDATIQAHGLPSIDAAALQSWGRADAEAALWALLAQAIQTPAASRGADQQNAVGWLTAVARRQDVQAADAAGLEYVKWAGFDQAAYQKLVATNPSLDALRALLDGTPLNYNTSNTSQATGGYCVYRSPAPYQDEYTANIFTPFAQNTASPTCYGNGGVGSLFGGPPTPSYDQFVKWGEATESEQLDHSAGFAGMAHDIAVSAGLGGALVSAGAAGAGLSAALADVLVGSAIQAALFPFTGIDAAVFSSAAEAAALAATGAEAGAATAASIGSAVGVVITALTVAIIAGINVANAANLPGQLATLVADAPATTPDLAARLADAEKAKGLYALFVGATLPAPRFTTCDNSFLIGGPRSSAIPCLNAPAIPAATPSDPLFVIAARGASTTSTAPSFSWVDAGAGTSATARLHDTWFIDHVAASGSLPAVTVQTLQIHYSDWAGAEHSAWLIHDPQKGYMFLSIGDATAAGGALDLATCVTTGACSYSATIHYVGTDGTDYTASVIAPPVPLVAPTYSTPALAGSPITFNAHGISPSGLDTAYRWRFEQPGAIAACFSGQPCDPYPYSAPVSGPEAQHAWDHAGTFHVELTATDAAGRATVDTFTIDVAATTSLRWSPAPSIRYGTPLDGAILNAMDSTLTPPPAGVTCLNGPCPVTETPVAGTFSYSVDGAPASPSQVLAAGDHRLQVQFSPSDPAHYVTPAPLASDLVVEAAPLTITAPDRRMTYGGAVPPFDAAASGLVNGDTLASLGLTCGARDGLGPVSPSSLPRQYPIECAFDQRPANYDEQRVPGTLTINPAPLTIAANDQRMVAGGAVPSFTPRYSGFVNGDTESHAGDFHPPTCRASDAAGLPVSSGTPAGSYPITCAGADSHAYRITYVPGTLTILPAL
ncbi:MAG TPA: MBG domain-containing protein [Bacillota bacterium]|nr:MBG domain-containing protein [Bacillota bacterium]